MFSQNAGVRYDYDVKGVVRNNLLKVNIKRMLLNLNLVFGSPLPQPEIRYFFGCN